MQWLKQFLKRIVEAEWFSYFLLILIGAGLYLKSLNFQLTYLDDNVWLKDYLWYLKDAKNIWASFVQQNVLFGGLFYRPLIYTSFIIDTLIGKGSLTVYHATNVIIHIINTCLLYVLFQNLKYTKQLSFWFACIFAAHPALTEAVVWIPGRTDSLLGLFIILSFIFYVKFVYDGRRRNFSFHVLFLLAALLTKESAIVLPVMCLFFYCFLNDKDRSLSVGLIQCLIWCLFIGLWLFVRSGILVKAPAVPLKTLIGSVIENSPAIISYLGKIIIPANLSVLPILKDLTLVYGLVALVILKVLDSMTQKKRKGFIYFGIIWFLLFLLPSLVLSFLKHEYRLYVPIIGVFLVIMEFCREHLDGKTPSAAFAKVAFAVVVVLATLSFHHADNFKGKFEFWQNAVEHSPNSPLAHRNLGAMYYLIEQFDQAKIEFKKALALNPYEAMVHNNLGLLYDREGKYKEAEAEYLMEIQINPNFDIVHYNLGLVYARQEKWKEAEAVWLRTIELNPRYRPAYKQLLAMYYNNKDYQNAAYYAGKVIEMGGSVPQDVIQKLR